MDKENFLAIDLFAGAGGLSEGLQEAGFDIVASSEINSIYAETYKTNHLTTHLYEGDVRKLSPKKVRKELGLRIGALDLLAGGPPCQGFSINAPVRSLNDHRNHLFLEFLKFVAEFRPKTILIENVPGLISTANGFAVQSIYKALKDLRYNIHHMILYAAHYGVPQMRWRAIFLASHEKSVLPCFPVPTHRANGVANFTGGKNLCFKTSKDKELFKDALLLHTTVEDALSDLPALLNGDGCEEMPYSSLPKSKYQEIARKDSEVLWNHRAPKIHQINVERMKYIKPGGSWRDIPFDLLPKGLKRARRSDHTRRYGRLDPKGLATTIMTKCDPHWGTFFHYSQNRVISVREAARLQSFPDKFKFKGSLLQQYQQVGNAVPPLLAKAIGLKIREALRQNQTNSKLCTV